jgi:hypothetical protein
MKQIVKKVILFVALCVIATSYCYAQEPSKVETKVKEIVKRYEKVKGVESVTVSKGRGLGLVKMMLSEQLGKDFMKGITSIIIINYSDAPQEVCLELRKEFDSFKSILQEFDPDKGKDKSKEKGASDDGTTRGFASISESDKSVSDLIISIEDKESKMIMYMAGKIKFE